MAITFPMPRCDWCSTDPLYIHYHDTEWGVPMHDTNALFEILILEGFQAGLSWWSILQRRDAFRRALADFDPHRLARLSDADIERLMQNASIIRNRRKLEATRGNAQAWLRLTDPAALIWSVTEGRTRVHHYASHHDVPASSPESEALSRTLKKAGFRFVGPTICHSLLQATGVLMEHTMDCFRYRELAGASALPSAGACPAPGTKLLG